MLFVGDIHINPRYSTQLLDTLREFLTRHDDQHIVFLGDYVYHFSYHRQSLLELLDLFLELAQSQRHVYILAGNHDWLGQHFVYSEIEKLFQTQQHPYLHLITQPQTYAIDGQDFLFLPYLLSWERYQPAKNSYPDRVRELQLLKDSLHTDERQSYLLNAYLEDQIATHQSNNPGQRLTVIHHYYTADTRFPGVKSIFHYKEKAISPHFLSYEHIRLISGHIHHSFSYHNYLCLGASRSSSPLETNLLQWISRYDHKSDQRYLQQIAVQPYLTLNEPTTPISQENLYQHWQDLQRQSKTSFTSSFWNIVHQYCELPIQRSTITVYTNTGSYERLEQTIDPSLHRTLRDIHLKQMPTSTDQAIQDLIESTQDFQSTRSNRKELLQNYLKTKYGDQAPLYLKTLQELDIRL